MMKSVVVVIIIMLLLVTFFLFITKVSCGFLSYNTHCLFAIINIVLAQLACQF